jgi:hypothetical protein
MDSNSISVPFFYLAYWFRPGRHRQVYHCGR